MRRKKIILIFDEMITGLRFQGSSVQDTFKLSPSLSTLANVLEEVFQLA